MKLNILFSREPFKYLFSKTIKYFLENRYNWKGEILWDQKFKKGIFFSVIEPLNLIFPAQKSFHELSFFLREHYYENNLLKYFLRIIFIRCCFFKFTRNLLTYRVLLFTETFPELDNFVFLGGNNTIKIINLNLNQCIVLNKYQFDSTFFINSLNVRKEFNFLNCPRIIEYNISQNWTIEPLLTGIPLDRQRKTDKTNQVLENAKSNIFELYKKTKTNISLESYVDSKMIEIKKEIDSLNSFYNNVQKEKLHSISDYIFSRLQRYSSRRTFIQLAMTHGDFHLGNIIYDYKNLPLEFKIIDWEYSDIRCIWYDNLFLELNSSSTKNLSFRIKKWIKENRLNNEKIIWCTKEKISKYNLEIIIYTFIFELLLLRLKESNVSYHIRLNKPLIMLINELSKLKL
tara:strand:+ start:117 stop:1319 length:1203 start_codon:yes stop_codon:yes gene_type:complete